MAGDCEFKSGALLRMRRECVASAKRQLAAADAELRRLQQRRDELWSALAGHDAAAREALAAGARAKLALHSRCSEELRGVLSARHERLAAARTALARRRRELARAAAELEVLRRFEERQSRRRRRKAESARALEIESAHTARRGRGETVSAGAGELT